MSLDTFRPMKTPTFSMRNLARSLAALGAGRTSSEALAATVREFLLATLRTFPWRVTFQDWTGARYDTGGDATHWSGHEALEIRLNEGAGRDLLALDGMRFLERFLDREVELTGNLYLLPELRNYVKLTLTPWRILQNRLRNLVFEHPSRARASVKSHYDISEEALFYLDRVYRSYSCAMFEEPDVLTRRSDLEVGRGQADTYDSLEKAQWRKFAHAADYLAPRPDETVLDVGCGYPGFLMVLMDRHAGAKVVGWTHSANQVREGRGMLAGYNASRYELNEGDYREDTRQYDHIHSTGMISHVGPPGPNSGLLNYVREVRRRIRTGGRYVHHALMIAHTGSRLFDSIGPAFNRRYVWPGFYWYTLGQHVTALEANGFQVMRAIDLTPHYAKTTWMWHERMCADRDRFVRHAGESTYRAWQLFLAGITGSFLIRQTHCYRLLCQATDTERPAVDRSDPARGISARMPIDLPPVRGARA
jgi:cyclopropane fatty-acyl-phospholipid synthase-like methyltransferase